MSKPTAYKRLGELFRALAHPVRLRILDVLARQEACVCHLIAVLDRPQPYISQQLAVLRQAGLVVDRREGNLIYYRLADDHVAHLLTEGRALVQNLLGERLDFLPVPSGVVEACSCPRCQG